MLESTLTKEDPTHRAVITSLVVKPDCKSFKRVDIFVHAALSVSVLEGTSRLVVDEQEHRRPGAAQPAGTRDASASPFSISFKNFGRVEAKRQKFLSSIYVCCLAPVTLL